MAKPTGPPLKEAGRFFCLKNAGNTEGERVIKNTTKTTEAKERAGEKGQSLVEFALVLPVFLILVFGILEFGVIMMDQIHLTNAANDGARVGAVKNGTDVQAISAASSSVGGVVSCPAGTPTASRTGTNPIQLTVTVTCSYSPITPLGGLLSSLVISSGLSGTAVMRVEQ
jgi:Flp pilus assembly protein TadG